MDVRLANLLRGLNRLERLDFGLAFGDSVVGVLTGDEGIGDKGLLEADPGRMFNNLGLRGGPEDTGVGVAEDVNPAVDDTVETIEGGGDGVMDLPKPPDIVEAGADLKAGAGVDISVFLLGRDKVELTDSGSGDLSMIQPRASIVSLLGLLATTTVLQTASRRKNSLIFAHMGLKFDSVPSTKT